MPEISVIVPVYNAMPYLKQCLESLSRQTFEDLEVILVDDGSTDGSAEFCRSWAEADGRAQLICQKHAGVTSARQTGIRLATAEYVAFVDSDDWLDPRAYECMYEAMCEGASDLVICDRYVSLGKQETLMSNSLAAGFYAGRRLEAEFFPHILANGNFFHWGIFPALWDKLFRLDMMREVLLAVSYEPSAIEDVGYSLGCMMRAKRVAVLHEAFYHYRQHGSSLVKEQQGAYLARYAAVADFLCQEARQLGRLEVLGPQLYDYFIFHMVPRLMDLCPGYQEQDRLLPFDQIGRGNRVVVYGAGNFGFNLWRFLKETFFCRLAGWLDGQAEKYRTLGWPVKRPDEVRDIEYDFIAVAVMSESAQQSIRKTLLGLGCEAEKIKCVDMEAIRSKEFAVMLRLPEEFRESWWEREKREGGL